MNDVPHHLKGRLIVQPRVIIIAGPNGAGKTTFAKEFLPREGVCTHFINADLIAAGLSPFDPDAAAYETGRLTAALIRQAIERGESIALETTPSGRRYREGWENFATIYRRIVDYWELHDNPGERPQLVEKGDNK